jgi:hypothetical protein
VGQKNKRLITLANISAALILPIIGGVTQSIIYNIICVKLAGKREKLPGIVKIAAPSEASF